jgi:hypothetical protein
MRKRHEVEYDNDLIASILGKVPASYFTPRYLCIAT